MIQTEVNKQLARPLAITAAILGIIQGVVWLVFSILCLCCYFGVIEEEASSTTGEYYNYIYAIFFKQLPDDGPLTYGDLILTPVKFSIFMWCYFGLSLFWFIESSFLLWVMVHNKWRFSTFSMGMWSALTLIILIIDVVFVGLIAHDYKVVQDTNEKLINISKTETLVSYGIVMSVAARGYILWIVDLIFLIILFKFMRDIVKYENSPPDMPIIYGYETETSNPPWQSDPQQSPWMVYNDPEFTNKNHGFERSQSFYPLTTPSERRNSYQSNSNDTNNNERTATIGRHRSEQNYLNKVQPPMIPEPDYTPPGTPLKSALRSTSDYLF